MILIKRAVSGLTLALALTVSASCSDHNSALVGRDAIPARAGQPIPDEYPHTHLIRVRKASEIWIEAVITRSGTGFRQNPFDS